MEMMFETNCLCKTFKTQKAVNEVSIHVRKGSLLRTTNQKR